MTVKNIIVKCAFANHTRPTQIFIDLANQFKSDIWVHKVVDHEERMVRAKSLLGVLSIVITDGDELTIRADGDDEIDAVEALANLVENGFNE